MFHKPIHGPPLTGKPKFDNPNNVEIDTTDLQGFCQFYLDQDAPLLIAVHESGIAWIPTSDIGKQTTLTLQSWGSVEGTAWNYDQRVINGRIDLRFYAPGIVGPAGSMFLDSSQTDDQGKFSFTHIPPGKVALYLKRMDHRSVHERSLIIQPGKISTTRLGGLGRPVVGRLTIVNPHTDIDFTQGFIRAHTEAPLPPPEVQTPDQHEAWRQREDVKQAFLSIRHHFITRTKDGSFRMEEVIPGRYTLDILLGKKIDILRSGPLAQYKTVFEVPTDDLQNSREPFDIGDIEVPLLPKIELGKTPAPLFSATDINGEEFSLSQFKGKYVVLDFWTAWPPRLTELPHLRNAFYKYHDRDDFVMIGLGGGNTVEKMSDFMEENNTPWRQAHVDTLTKDELLKDYGLVGFPSLILVDPEGIITNNHLRPETLSTMLDRYLK